MEAAVLLPPYPTLPNRPSSKIYHHYKSGRMMIRTNKRFLINAKQGEGEGEGEGKWVDESMVVLRMRIKKMKALEASDGSGDKEGAAGLAAVPDWKEWEKKVLARYQEGVGESMGALQSYLMKTRPSVALGMLALAAMAVPLTNSAVMANAIQVARGLLAGCHICIDIDF